MIDAVQVFGIVAFKPKQCLGVNTTEQLFGRISDTSPASIRGRTRVLLGTLLAQLSSNGCPSV